MRKEYDHLNRDIAGTWSMRSEHDSGSLSEQELVEPAMPEWVEGQIAEFDKESDLLRQELERLELDELSSSLFDMARIDAAAHRIEYDIPSIGNIEQDHREKTEPYSIGDEFTELEDIFRQTEKGRGFLEKLTQKGIPFREIAAGLVCTIGFHVGFHELSKIERPLSNVSELTHLLFTYGILEHQSAKDFFAELRNAIEADEHFFDTVNMGHLYIDYDRLVSHTIDMQQAEHAKQVFDSLVEYLGPHTDDPLVLAEMIGGAMGRYHPDARDMSSLLVDIHNFDNDYLNQDLVGNCEARAKIAQSLFHSLRPDVPVFMRFSLLVNKETKQYTPHVEAIIQVEGMYYSMNPDGPELIEDIDTSSLISSRDLWKMQVGLIEGTTSPNTDSEVDDVLRTFSDPGASVDHTIARQGVRLSTVLSGKIHRDVIEDTTVGTPDKEEPIETDSTSTRTGGRSSTGQIIGRMSSRQSGLGEYNQYESVRIPSGESGVIVWVPKVGVDDKEYFEMHVDTIKNLYAHGYTLERLGDSKERLGDSNEYKAVVQTPQERASEIARMFTEMTKRPGYTEATYFLDFVEKYALTEEEYVAYEAKYFDFYSKQWETYIKEERPDRSDELLVYPLYIPAFIQSYERLAQSLRDRTYPANIQIIPLEYTTQTDMSALVGIENLSIYFDLYIPKFENLPRCHIEVGAPMPEDIPVLFDFYLSSDIPKNSYMVGPDNLSLYINYKAGNKHLEWVFRKNGIIDVHIVSDDGAKKIVRLLEENPPIRFQRVKWGLEPHKMQERLADMYLAEAILVNNLFYANLDVETTEPLKLTFDELSMSIASQVDIFRERGRVQSIESVAVENVDITSSDMEAMMGLPNLKRITFDESIEKYQSVISDFDTYISKLRESGVSVVFSDSKVVTYDLGDTVILGTSDNDGSAEE